MGKIAAGVNAILRANEKARALWGDPVVAKASAPGMKKFGPEPGTRWTIGPDEPPVVLPADVSEDIRARLKAIYDQPTPPQYRSQAAANAWRAEQARPLWDEVRAMRGQYPEHQFETGKPVTARVFHGTYNPEVEEFKDRFLGSATNATSARMGHFFGGSPETAEGYSGTRLSTMMRQVDRLDRLSNEDRLNVMSSLLRHPSEFTSYLFANPKAASGLPQQIGPWKGATRGSPVLDTSYWDVFNTALETQVPKDPLSLAAKNTLEEITRSSDIYLPPLDAPTSIPAYLNMKNPLVEDWKRGDYMDRSYSEFLNRARSGGHDSAIMMNTFDGGPLDNIFVTFDPRRVRAQAAAFDPANINRANIMGNVDPRLLPATGAVGAGGLYGMGYLMDEEQQR